jgi:hypothetical protein
MCEVKDKETVENPKGGGAGKDEVTGMTFGPCAANPEICRHCEMLEVTATASEKKPWKSELKVVKEKVGNKEEEFIRDDITGVDIMLECNDGAGKKPYSIHSKTP